MADSSIIAEIAGAMENALVRLPRYEKAIADAEPLFNMEGERIEYLCRSQPKWLFEYSTMESELKVMVETLTSKRDEVQGKLWKKYVEGYARALSSTDIKSYINNEKEFAIITQIINEVNFVKAQMSAIVESFRQMGWALKLVVELRVNQLHQEIL